MYEQCKFKSQCQCAKFIGEKKEQWQTLASWLFGPGQLVHGQLSKHSDWLQACFPHTSMSSVLLVGQAYMWAHGHGKSGGLADQHDRHAADLLCRGFV